MGKLFEVDYRTKSVRDSVSGGVPTNGGVEFARGAKGYCMQSKTGLLTYPAVDLSTTDFSIVLWISSVDYSSSYFFGEYINASNRWYLRVDGTPVFQFYSQTGGVTGLSFAGRIAGSTVDSYNGVTLCLCLNVDRDNTISGYCNGLPLSDITFSAGNLISDSLDVFGYGASYSDDTQMYKLRINDHLMSEDEMDSEYQEFLNAPAPTSSPTVIRPKFPVSGDEEKLSDPLFDDTSSDPWDVTANVAWVSGESIFDSTTGNAYADVDDIDLDDYGTYELTYEVVSKTGTASLILSSVGGLDVGSIPDTIGIHTVYRDSNGTADKFRMYRSASGGGILVLKNIRLKRVQKCVLAYDFQNWNGSSVVPDISGNGNDGTVNGFVDSTVEGANFDGDTSHVAVGAGALGLSSFTLEAAVIYNSSTYGSRIFHRNANEILWKFQTAGKQGLIFKVGGTQYGWFYSNEVGVVSGKLRHFVAKYNSTTGIYTFYIDGLEQGSGSIGVTGAVDDTQNFGVGGYSTSGYSMDGSMRYFKLYNYALSEDEVKQKYNKIARTCDLSVMGNNLLPDGRTYGVGEVIDV